MNAPVRVVLADDQTLVRAGLAALLGLAAGIEVVGEASDGREALDVVAATRPDVLLLDLRMPVLDGLGTLEALAGAEHRPAVLVLTTFDDDDLVVAALRAGARGYLLKDVTLDEVVEGVLTLARGERLVQPAVTARVLDRLAAAPLAERVPAGPAVSMTPRETEVLRLLAAGWSNREIGRGLHLAEGTVKNHVSAIMLKLGVRDRTRAVVRALDLGLVGR